MSSTKTISAIILFLLSTQALCAPAPPSQGQPPAGGSRSGGAPPQQQSAAQKFGPWITGGGGIAQPWGNTNLAPSQRSGGQGDVQMGGMGAGSPAGSGASTPRASQLNPPNMQGQQGQGQQGQQGQQGGSSSLGTGPQFGNSRDMNLYFTNERGSTGW
ncbi:hypothetical protein C1H76_8989 [Elsinoe australis]|uniref:Uncharacterized protein n=1 Tax=Elsinoe australis TaxID=40998 RepID=A0A4U7AUZ7_9PEZI|nr:hypothetical protein C1H76_8989 [Elsinoe australis]